VVYSRSSLQQPAPNPEVQVFVHADTFGAQPDHGAACMTATPAIDLDSLSQGIPVIAPGAAGFYRHNCMVCFDSQGHSSGVDLSLEREDGRTSLPVRWAGAVDTRMKNAYADLRKATEHAACAVALLLVRELTEFTAFEQSSIGTTVDYYLTPQAPDETLIFNRAARLEASGILKEQGSNTVEERVKEKLERLKPDSMPALIAVVEFGSPKSKMVRS